VSHLLAAALPRGDFEEAEEAEAAEWEERAPMTKHAWGPPSLAAALPMAGEIEHLIASVESSQVPFIRERRGRVIRG
jgi:hypothetical protein